MSRNDSSNFRIDARNDGNNGLGGYTEWICPVGLTTSSTSWWNTYNSNGYSAFNKQAMMVHELGHALGLAHVSSSTAIMNRNPLTTGRNTPNTDDKNGVNSLY